MMKLRLKLRALKSIDLLSEIPFICGDGMQERNNFLAKNPFIFKALRRSSVRRKILEYLFDVGPNGSYISEIAYHIRASPTNVIGAIRGMGKRYRKEDSLLNLQVVEELQSNNGIKLYRLTDLGKEVVEALRNYKFL